MNRDRAIAILLGFTVAGLLVDRSTIEGFGFGLIIGLMLGCLVGTAFVYGEPRIGAPSGES